MLQSHANPIIEALHIAEAGRPVLQWLASPNVPRQTIAHLGCHIGFQSMAIVKVLNPSELYAVDLDDQAIDQAQNFFARVLENCAALAAIAANSENLPTNFLRWWDAVPEILRDAGPIHFMCADITKATPLPASYFDLVYSDHVLDHIWHASGEQGVRNAVSEMNRLARPGSGLVVADVPTTWRSHEGNEENFTHLDFHHLFEMEGLAPTTDITIPDFVGQTLYVYRKP